MESLIAFSLSALAVLAVPGPTNTLLAASGATVGARRSLHLLLTVLAAYQIAIVVLRAIVDVVAPSGATETAMRLAIAAYLVFLAIRLWRITPGATVAAFDARRVLVATLLNPKALVVGLLLMPKEPFYPLLHFAIFSLSAVAAGAAWIVTGRLATNVAGDRSVVWVPKIASLAMATFATWVLIGFVH